MSESTSRDTIMSTSASMDGKFYHFKPIHNADAKEELQVDFMYRKHPVIVINQYGGKGKVWVVTATSHPHFDNQPADNFLPIHPTPSSTSSYDRPLTMKRPNLTLPKNSWVVVNSHCRIPKDALREMKQGDVQYALDEGSLKTLRASNARAVAPRSCEGKATKAKQGKAKGQEGQKAKSASKAAKKLSAAEEQATDALGVKQSISALEVRLACLESLCRKLDVRIASIPLNRPTNLPIATTHPQRSRLEDHPDERDAELIAQETVHQMTTPNCATPTRPIPPKKRSNMKRLMSKVWSEMAGTSSSAIEEPKL